MVRITSRAIRYYFAASLANLASGGDPNLIVLERLREFFRPGLIALEAYRQQIREAVDEARDPLIQLIEGEALTGNEFTYFPDAIHPNDEATGRWGWEICSYRSGAVGRPRCPSQGRVVRHLADSTAQRASIGDGQAVHIAPIGRSVAS